MDGLVQIEVQHFRWYLLVLYLTPREFIKKEKQVIL